MIQKAFVDESMGITQIKEWYRRLKNGRTSVGSDPRSGRPSLTPENIERVRLVIEGDRRLTVLELENDLGIPKTTVWEILNKILGMTRVRAKFIPKLLMTEQKDLRSEIAQDNLEIASDDENVLKKVMTGDESWVTILKLNNNLPVEASRRATAEKSASKSEPCRVNADFFFRL